MLAWQISAEWRFDAGLVTEVEVRFVPEGPRSTRVELEHRGLEAYGPAADETRSVLDSPNGWSGLLARFADSLEA